MSLELQRDYARRRMLQAIEQKGLPSEDKHRIAMEQFVRKCHWAGHGRIKPRVMIFTNKSRTTYVLRVGQRYQSANSWENLIANTAFQTWKIWHGSAYAKRLGKSKS